MLQSINNKLVQTYADQISLPAHDACRPKDRKLPPPDELEVAAVTPDIRAK